MSRPETLKVLETIYRDILDNDNIVLSNETTAADIEEWDSLTHIQLIVAAEKHFGIRFTSMEIQALKNVGEFIDLILSKTSR